MPIILVLVITGFPLVIKHGALENGPFINDVSIESSIQFGDFPASHVWLPEGISINIPVLSHDHPMINHILNLNPTIKPPFVSRLYYQRVFKKHLWISQISNKNTISPFSYGFPRVFRPNHWTRTIEPIATTWWSSSGRRRPIVLHTSVHPGRGEPSKAKSAKSDHHRWTSRAFDMLFWCVRTM